MNPAVAISQGIVILVLSVLGGFTLVKHFRNRAAQLFAALCFLLCCWIAIEIGTDYFEAGEQLRPALFLRNLTKLINVLTAATFVCFAWYFPRKTPAIGFKHVAPLFLVGLVYAIGVFTTRWDARNPEIANGRLHLDYGPLHLLYFVYMAACGLYGVGHLLYKRHRFQSSLARLQIQYVTIGVGLSYLISVVFCLILPLLGSLRYFFIGALSPAIGVLFIGYAIIRHQVLAIDTDIHLTLIWLLMSSLVVLLPVSVAIVLGGEWIRGLSNWGLVLFATALFFLFFAYTRKIQPLIDRRFRRDYYARQAAINGLIRDIHHLKDLPTLARQIIHTTQRVLRVRRATLLAYREGSQDYLLIDSRAERRTDLNADDPFLHWLADADNDTILEREQIELQPPHYSIDDHLAQSYFQRMSAEVCVPFVHEGQLLGALNLGRRERRSWHLRKQEVDLLTRLSAAATLALDNLRLHEAQLDSREKRTQAELIAAVSGALAHSVKNPLGIIDGELNLLRDALTPLDIEEVHPAVSRVEEQVLRIEQIMGQLQNADIGPPDLAPCDLSLVFREAVAEVRGAHPNSSVRICVAGDGIPEILGDTDQLRLAFGNLIANAYQAMESSDGTLAIDATAATHQDTPSGRTEIRDTGCGMPADLILDVTSRPFVTRKRTGTGLGVWTARMIIEAHGGRLQLDSEEGIGTMVREDD